MKRLGRHPDKALTAIFVKNAREPGRYADGIGLYLVVDPGGAKRWISRLTVQGKRRDMGLGSVSSVTLAEARVKALAAYKSAKNGDDPIADRLVAKRVIPVFNDVIISVYEEHKHAWKSIKHGNQWLKTLQDYAGPQIGTIKIDQIETHHLLSVLVPIWNSKPETAKRVKQRLKVVFDWAKAKGFREGGNPVDGVKFGLNKQPRIRQHYKALPYNEIGKFWNRLESKNSNKTANLAFKFLILTASRLSEVLNAEWSEIDFQTSIWTKPAERMKNAREHRVPLGVHQLAILNKLNKTQAQSKFIFYDDLKRDVLPKAIFFRILRSLNFDITTHGFRSTFRDWAAESSLNFSNEACEIALAHSIKDTTESAYRRGDLLEKRRLLMNAWADFVIASSTSAK
jgi:integrase